MQLKVIRLFSISKENEEFKYSVVVYMKRPYTFKKANEWNGKGKTTIDSWKHYVRINLWLIEFNFDWLT